MATTATTIPVKVYGSTYEVNESLSLAEMERAEPAFFRTKFGKCESHRVYRGCLITRYTRLYSRGQNERVTVAYLWGRNDDEKVGLSSFCLGHTTNAYRAKKLIDIVLNSGIARE